MQAGWVWKLYVIQQASGWSTFSRPQKDTLGFEISLRMKVMSAEYEVLCHWEGGCWIKELYWFIPWITLAKWNAVVRFSVPSCSCERAVGPTLFLINEVTEYLYVPRGRPRLKQEPTNLHFSNPTTHQLLVSFHLDQFNILVHESREIKQQEKN